MIRKIKSFFHNHFDLEDLYTLIAISMIFYGIYNISKPYAYIIVGSIILVIIAFGSRNSK